MALRRSPHRAPSDRTQRWDARHRRWQPARAITVQGADEIAAMGRAVEIFRKNTVERDDLLAEKAQAAERTREPSQGAHGRTGTIGRGAAGPRRGQPSGQLDDQPGDRVVHDRRQGGSAFGRRGWHDLRVRRGKPGIPAARHLRHGRRADRRGQGPAHPHG